MNQRLAIWPLSNAKAANAQRQHGPQAAPTRPDLRLILGGNAPRLERLSPKQRVIALIVTVLLALFGVVTFHVLISQNQYALESLQSKADDQQAQYEKLRLQVAQLDSPERIATDAQTRLGLVSPDHVTAIAPTAADMPKGLPVTPGNSAGSTADDDNGWSSIKPHLSASSS